MTEYQVTVSGLSNLNNFKELRSDISKKASMAINATAKKSRTWAVEEIRDQVNFPSNYFSGTNNRLKVTTFASADSLEAVIRGRKRATSLARFSNSLPGNKGVIIQVKPGRSKVISTAFLINLKSGNGQVDTKNNLGLAVRTQNGRPNKAYKPVRIAPNLYLLYGPSVDQVFGGKKGVAEKISPQILAYLEKEFLRLLDL